ncbi:unnamed protein product [Rhizoctonia solani]|uniref:Reverse transcriptase domain-containing protein n=1 Tax=Rhizoctonia solani TaxID=456999 RepID=A0A8H2XHH0_9AGAM|nr:unnamed protein product [Rhizoctonia solani]
MPASLASKPCLECFNRSRTNPSGRSRCSGGNPCKWCKNNKAVCSYEYQAHDASSTTEVALTAETTTATAPKLSIAEPVSGSSSNNNPSNNPPIHPEMFVFQLDDGSVKVGFKPDPHNLGIVDPDILGEGDIDPYTLPIENYNILVNAVKRKYTELPASHIDQFTSAKRLRGGVDHAIPMNAEGHGPGEAGADLPQPPPPPPPQPPQAQDPAAQNPDENTRLLQTLIASSNAATLALTQVLRRDNDNRGVDRQNRDKRIHRLDLVEEDETLSRVDTMIPRQMYRIFELGWKTDWSMYMLSDEYCESPDAKKVAADKLFIGQGNSLVTQAADMPLVSRDPTTITLAHFMQGSPRFVHLVRITFGNELALAWQTHCDNILNHSRRDKIWHLLMLYDTAIRRRATYEPLRPDNWHDEVFEQIELDWNREQNEKQRKLLEIQSAKLEAQLASLAARNNRDNGNSSNNRRRSDAPPSYNSSNSAGSLGPGQHSFRADNKASTDSSHANNQNSRCFRCARWNHVASKCSTGFSTANHSATTSTSAKAAHMTSANEAHTSARYVATPNTEHSPAPNSPNVRRVSPNLIPDAWESMLRDLGILDQFGDIPSGLREGFRIGAAGPVPCTIINPNHKSALDRPDIIEEHIKTELNTGRYTGPFTRAQLKLLIGPFHTAPLGAVDKPSAPGKFRVVQDFSFPRSPTSNSLNAQICSEDFHCEWGFFHNVVQALHDLPPDAMAATCDVDAAFRQMPIHPDDRPHTVVCWGNDFYVDAFLPFGVASANGIFGRMGDAMARIYTLRGFGIILKWVDDFLFIQTPVEPGAPDLPPRFSIRAIYDLAETLGWPWKHVKTVPFANIFTYLGFEWNIAQRWVSIPTAKKEKYLRRIRDWLGSDTVSLKDTEKITGTLIHCTLAIPCGRPHVAAIISFEASFPSAHSYRFLKRAPTPAAHSNAEWWLDILSSDPVALELAVDGVISLGIRDASLTFHCDNQGVVYAWASGRSRNPQQNAVFISIMEKAAASNISIKVVYIASADNPADAPSRGLSPIDCTRSPLQIPVPSSYAPFIAAAIF